MEKVNNVISKNSLGYVKYVDYDELVKKSNNLSFLECLKMGLEITKEEYDEGIHKLVFKN